MGYMPTLGGLKMAREFLAESGIVMPYVQTNMYENPTRVGTRRFPGEGRMLDLDQAIKVRGGRQEITDVRLYDDQTNGYILFSDLSHCGRVTRAIALKHGFDVWIEYYGGLYNHDRLRAFMESSDGVTFVNLARWGVIEPTGFERLLYRLFPNQYATRYYV